MRAELLDGASNKDADAPGPTSSPRTSVARAKSMLRWLDENRGRRFAGVRARRPDEGRRLAPVRGAPLVLGESAVSRVH
jgi:hypothetical protein